MRAKDHVRAKNKYSHIAGVDEVGRGPLAGDVVAAAVILPANHGIAGLADSKKLTEKKRLQLYQDIKARAVAWCVDRASVAEIDELNILQASLLAMRRAVDGLNISPDFVKVDGNKLPVWSYPSESIVKGDSTVEAISAASILAKVDRDNEMVELDQRHPVYGFAQHKGYPTKQHLAALGLYGVTPYHRKTFAPVARVLPSDE